MRFFNYSVETIIVPLPSILHKKVCLKYNRRLFASPFNPTIGKHLFSTVKYNALLFSSFIKFFHPFFDIFSATFPPLHTGTSFELILLANCRSLFIFRCTRGWFFLEQVFLAACKFIIFRCNCMCTIAK